MLFFKNLFSKHLGFQPIDPLADGLAEEIEAEQREPQAIHLNIDDEADVQRFWSEVEHDIHEGGAVEFSGD